MKDFSNAHLALSSAKKTLNENQGLLSKHDQFIPLKQCVGDLLQKVKEIQFLLLTKKV